MPIVIQQSQFKHQMQEEDKKQNYKQLKKSRKKVKLDRDQSQNEQKKQNEDDNQQYSEQDDQDSQSGWSSEVVQPAIKSMSFRPKRGTRMKDLIKGKLRKDLFWEKYQPYFGGDINRPEQSEDEEDYQASSSGRDQFDSDFDLTDSYVGKRGRKKGTKIKRNKKKALQKKQAGQDALLKPKGKRGRKKKMFQPVQIQQKQNQGQQLKTTKKELIQEYLKMQIKMQIQFYLMRKQVEYREVGSILADQKDDEYKIKVQKDEGIQNRIQRYTINQATAVESGFKIDGENQMNLSDD